MGSACGSISGLAAVDDLLARVARSDQTTIETIRERRREPDGLRRRRAGDSRAATREIAVIAGRERLRDLVSRRQRALARARPARRPAARRKEAPCPTGVREVRERDGRRACDCVDTDLHGRRCRDPSWRGACLPAGRRQHVRQRLARPSGGRAGVTTRASICSRPVEHRLSPSPTEPSFASPTAASAATASGCVMPPVPSSSTHTSTGTRRQPARALP